MKVLVVGSGGREHCLAWKLSLSSKVTKIYTAPGNGGTSILGENIDIKDSDIEALVKFALDKKIDLTVVGPEIPLSLGIVDRFEKEGLVIFGPSKDMALLESSKVYSKEKMKQFSIPTADFETFSDKDKALKYIETKASPLVIKADGLAAGKGVFVAKTKDEAKTAVKVIMEDKMFGVSGDKIIIEETLIGQEASILAFTDGKTIIPLVASQDHKRIFDNDQGPNTGGMGAYAPAPLID